MVLGALGCMNNADFEKKNILHIVSIFRIYAVHVVPTSMQFYADDGLPLNLTGDMHFYACF